MFPHTGCICNAAGDIIAAPTGVIPFNRTSYIRYVPRNGTQAVPYGSAGGLYRSTAQVNICDVAWRWIIAATLRNTIQPHRFYSQRSGRQIAAPTLHGKNPPFSLLKPGFILLFFRILGTFLSIIERTKICTNNIPFVWKFFVESVINHKIASELLTENPKSAILLSVRKYRKKRAVTHFNGDPHKSCMHPSHTHGEGADYTIQGD